MHRDESFMRLALEQADEARRAGEIPMGAVVVVGGVVVGRGHNRPVGTTDPTAHAEIQALREAARNLGNYRLVGATLYCTVEPCVMCLGAILHSRVSRLVYGASDPKIGAVDRIESWRSDGAAFNHRFDAVGGVLGEEAAERLVTFFRERRDRASSEGDAVVGAHAVRSGSLGYGRGAMGASGEPWGVHSER